MPARPCTTRLFANTNSRPCNAVVSDGLGRAAPFGFVAPGRMAPNSPRSANAIATLAAPGSTRGSVWRRLCSCAQAPSAHADTCSRKFAVCAGVCADTLGATATEALPLRPIVADAPVAPLQTRFQDNDKYNIKSVTFALLAVVRVPVREREPVRVSYARVYVRARTYGWMGG